MHGRPVALVIARQRSVRQSGASRWFGQEIDIRRPADHFSHGATEETPRETKAKRVLIKGDSLLKILDVNV
jgi:hypothetical protein